MYHDTHIGSLFDGTVSKRTCRFRQFNRDGRDRQFRLRQPLADLSASIRAHRSFWAAHSGARETIQRVKDGEGESRSGRDTTIPIVNIANKGDCRIQSLPEMSGRIGGDCPRAASRPRPRARASRRVALFHALRNSIERRFRPLDFRSFTGDGHLLQKKKANFLVVRPKSTLSVAALVLPRARACASATVKFHAQGSRASPGHAYVRRVLVRRVARAQLEDARTTARINALVVNSRACRAY